TPGLWDAHLQFASPRAYVLFILCVIGTIAGAPAFAILALAAAQGDAGSAALIALGASVPIIAMSLIHMIRTGRALD
ncbi:hypothetical protein ACOI1H_23245, partial [Loktanella sp. DJP18]|uniref:hypothetical protein n=1 Tax=Loktanella sp. DJP18 TaxID=3409788 RepID=UPI003BB59DAD